jgi:hypothetical protein
VIAWWLVTYGVTLAITGSKIGAPLRRLVAFYFGDSGGKFMGCPMCIGWWIGLILTPLIPSPVVTDSIWFTVIANAFASSAACWITHVVLVRLGSADL